MKANHAEKTGLSKRTGKSILLLFPGILAYVMPLAAETDYVNGIEWVYRINNGVAEIYNGGMPAIPTSTSGAITIPSYLGGYPVRSIGEYAFADCKGLTSATIPYGVTNLGGAAFDHCTGLRSVTIPGSVKSIGVWAFAGCNALTSVTMGNGVEVIMREAFAICGLESIDIPESVWSIGWSAFESCRSLKRVRMPLIYVNDSVFRGCAENLTILYWGYDYDSSIVVRSNSTKYGTVSGSGTYQFGTTITLKARAKSGYAFAGWFKDKAYTRALNPKGCDNRNPTVSYIVPSVDATIYAKFISKSVAKKHLKFSSAAKKLAKTPKKATMGKSLSLSLGISSATLIKVSAKGLPRGLSIDKDTGKIKGKPTRSGKYTAKVTVKDAAGNVITQKVKITVYVPSNIKGTYYGYTKEHSFAVTVIVSSFGKVSVKVKSYKLSGTRIELDNKGHYIFHKMGTQKHYAVGMSIDINPLVKNELTGHFALSHEGVCTLLYSEAFHAIKTR